MSYAARTMGTVATLLPQIKRAVVQHTDGRTLTLVPDTNLSNAAGDDITGVAKFYIYASSDSTRASWAPTITYTPTQAGSSSTKRFIGSMAINSDNDLFVAYQGTDNSLRLITWNWNGASYDAGVSTTVVAANAVTNRYRAIDIDVNGSATGNPAIMVYEANASTGQGAYIRVYIRLNDGTTWRKAYETQIQTTGFIKDGSEDVSVSHNASGVSGSTVYLALYYTRTNTTTDSGDTLIEINFNVSAGVDNGAFTTITWKSNLNIKIASGSRRGWLFKNQVEGGLDCWVFGGIVGSSLPFYEGVKLFHNSSSFIENKTNNAPADITSRRYLIASIVTKPSYANQSCVYSDQRLQFVFVGDYATRAVVIRWADVSPTAIAVSIDPISRFLDNNYRINDGPLAIYGGGNAVNSGKYEYTSLAVYGNGGTSVSSTPGVYVRKARVIIEDTIPTPVMIKPVSATVGQNLVQFQVQSTASLLYHMVHGKLDMQVATDTGFVNNLVSMREPDSLYRAYESGNGQTFSSRYITYDATAGQQLFTQTWYVRYRILDDMGGASAWATASFNVSHPPAAIPRIPAAGSTLQFTSGDVTFTWDVSDTEPLDTQTAYQIVVTRLDTNSIVIDSGKVLSSEHQAVLTIPINLANYPLSYTVKLWDSDDNPGLASNPIQFTLATPPVVWIGNPANGDVVTTGLPLVAWSFSATGRTQTHYRVVITDTGLNAVAADTGWVGSSAQSHQFTTQVLVNLHSYSVVVSVRDNAGLTASSNSNVIGNGDFNAGTISGWSGGGGPISLSTFWFSSYNMELTSIGAAHSATTISYPVVANEAYTAKATIFSVLGWTPMVLRIDWRDAVDASISVSDFSGNATAHNFVAFQVTATAPATAVAARVTILINGAETAGRKTYVDDVSLVHAPTNFTTTWVAPVDGDIAVTIPDNYKVLVAWTNANQDTDFVAWRVYRKYNKSANVDLDEDNTANTWVLVYETSDVLASYQFRDYFAPNGKPITYAISQMVDRFGSLLESPLSVLGTVTMTADRYYFVPAVPIGTIASFEASSVVGDSFTREVEQQTLHILGRGRQVQIGDDLGYSGSLTLKLRNPATARSDREFVEALARADNAKVFIRSPFGDVLYVVFQSPSFNRMAGVGPGDMGDLTVPYVEVFQDVPITRT